MNPFQEFSFAGRGRSPQAARARAVNGTTTEDAAASLPAAPAAAPAAALACADGGPSPSGRKRLPEASPAATPKRRGGKAGAPAKAAGKQQRAQQLPLQPGQLPPGGMPEKLGIQPLRLIIVGHNPSDHAWASGHFYSNPSNRMWPLLISTGIAPAGIRGAYDDDRMPALAGVGFTDIGTGTPGTDSSQFSSELIRSTWAPSFYNRLSAYLQRTCASIGCVCGRCGAPCIVAFSGKRQYLELLNAPPAPPPPAPQLAVDGSAAAGPDGSLPALGKQSSTSSSGGGGRRGGGGRGPKKATTVDLGRQSQLPPGWPLPAATEVWVLTSTSGASALTNEQRAAPYLALASRLREIPWPRGVRPACAAGGGGGARG